MRGSLLASFGMLVASLFGNAIFRFIDNCISRLLDC